VHDSVFQHSPSISLERLGNTAKSRLACLSPKIKLKIFQLLNSKNPFIIIVVVVICGKVLRLAVSSFDCSDKAITACVGEDIQSAVCVSQIINLMNRCECN